jgi:uncharacterized protein YjbI with pentapeptide repeats
MANPDHIAQLVKGVTAWNAWREENPHIDPDLSDANLSKANLRGANLTGVDLYETKLGGANLSRANLKGANLTEANLFQADLNGANLVGAVLRGAKLGAANLNGANLTDADLIDAELVASDINDANLRGVDLYGADLTKANLVGTDLIDARLFGAKLLKANLSRANLAQANLTDADLRGATLSGAKLDRASLVTAVLVNSDLTGADLTGCRIFGVSAWGLKLDRAKQQNLIITPANEPEITLDNIEVAQFVYLMLHNEKIRDVIDIITSKAVLILGRFTEERKAVLDAMRDKLRERGYLPILFDFKGSSNRTTDETITLLARMARFIVADLSDAKSVLQELRTIVPNLPTLPVQPVIVATQAEPGMFDFYHHFPWFLKVHRYDNQEQLIADLSERVILPAEVKVQELRRVQPPSM